MDDEDGVIHDAFSTENLWKSSSFFQDSSTYESSLFAPLQLDLPSIKLNHTYAPKRPLEHELQLPDIETFEFGALPEVENFDLSSVSLDTTPLEEEHEYIWQVALELGPANKNIEFYTWEAFESPGHVEPRTSYITELGPKALDAALSNNDDKVPVGRVIREHILLDALWNLGLGRTSVLFKWDATLRTFVPTIPDGRASGLSLSCAKSLTGRFILTGSTFLYLRSFVERTFASTASIPARVALAASVSTILTTFEDHLGRHSNSIRSLLELQHLFTKPGNIMIHVARIVDAVKHAESNEQLSSVLHHRVLELEEGDDILRRLSLEILRHVSEPSLELFGEWIGIQKEQNTMPIINRGNFVAIDEDSESQGPTEYTYNADSMPYYITPEDGNTIFEIGRSLRFLRHHHPAHPLASTENMGTEGPKLEWRFEWQDIEKVAVKAKAYEETLRNAILDFGKCSPKSSKDPVQTIAPPASGTFTDIISEAGFGSYIEESARVFDEKPGQMFSALPDELQVLTSRFLSDAATTENIPSFSPPISLTSTLSFRPLLAAQAKLVNATTLRLFLRSHQLRLHLSLQRQYHLLGDGVFSSRLASALFDPERETAERHKGVMRSGVHMGLQLGSRSAWPPASSELRLALMGVLSESYYASALYLTTKIGQDSIRIQRDREDLPGQLNFAIRQLSEPEMEKIMDPDSLYALDFLRLQYLPPSPLNLVISSSSLDKYDHIFKFLLRLLRMLFVISHLPRSYKDIESRHFRMEAHHVVTAFSSYIFQTGIAEHWDAFESYISTIETRLAEEDAAGELGTRITSGLDALRSAHELCLDSIMFSLLLRRRQKKVMTLLEDIFDHILLFAKITRDEEADGKHDVKELYAKLKGKIRVFTSVCRGLTGKKGYGKGRGTSEENTLERLCLLLEMNAYYTG